MTSLYSATNSAYRRLATVSFSEYRAIRVTDLSHCHAACSESISFLSVAQQKS